jgi:DNA repair exonuclease SbcCD nuclease subunit
MTKVILLGDPHIGKGQNVGKIGIGSNLNSRIADQINLLDWTLDKAIAYDAEHIIITGDLFEDPKPHPSLIAIVIAWLKKCQAHYVQVHIILGNHDMLRSGSVFTSSLDIISEMDLEGIYVYKTIDTIMLGSSAFTLVPFRDRKSFSVALNEDALNLIRDSLVYELTSIPISYKKFLIGHLAIEGAIPVGDEIDDITNELYCPVNMFEGYDYVWMGHVHKPQIMQNGSVHKPHIAHIGSMDVSNFGETDQKKRIVIIDCDSLSQDYFIEYLPTRPLKKLTVVVPKDTEDTTAYVLEEIKKANSDYAQSIVRVEISLSSPELKSVNKGQIESYLTKQGAFNVTGISESKKATLIKKDTVAIIDSKMDVPSAIKAYADKYVDVDMRADYIELSMEIYNSYKSESKE